MISGVDDMEAGTRGGGGSISLGCRTPAILQDGRKTGRRGGTPHGTPACRVKGSSCLASRYSMSSLVGVFMRVCVCGRACTCASWHACAWMDVCVHLDVALCRWVCVRGCGCPVWRASPSSCLPSVPQDRGRPTAGGNRPTSSLRPCFHVVNARCHMNLNYIRSVLGKPGYRVPWGMVGNLRCKQARVREFIWE